jgi:hypothetical protein
VTVLKREQILAALATALGNVPRNIPLGDITAAPHRALHDGDAELIEEFINPPIYEWTIRPVLFFVITWPDQASPDTALAAMIEAAATTLDGIVDQLGGLVTDIRVQPPNFAPQSLWGAANMKGAEVPIEIDYWSSSSLG